MDRAITSERKIRAASAAARSIHGKQYYKEEDRVRLGARERTVSSGKDQLERNRMISDTRYDRIASAYQRRIGSPMGEEERTWNKQALVK